MIRRLDQPFGQPSSQPLGASIGTRLAATLAILLLSTVAASGTLIPPAQAQEPATQAPSTPAPTAPATDPGSAAEPALHLMAITITPAKPAADTLCQLRVTVRNDGTSTVSALRFEVSIGDTALEVYERQVFMDAIPPGTETEVTLFNFWTSETGRPAPKDGTLTVTVNLREARGVTIETEGDTAETTTETWTLGEPIAPLPKAVSTTLTLKTARDPAPRPAGG